MIGQRTIITLALGVASAALASCGPRFHNAHTLSSDCAAYTQACSGQGYQSSRYGNQHGYNQPQLIPYQQNQYDFAYGAQHIIPYSTLPASAPYPPAVSYVQSQQSVVSYVPAPAPITAPAPIVEPAPIYDYQADFVSEPLNDTAPLSSWAAPEEPAWTPPWRTESDCPSGTIEGYGGGDCVQVEILRK